MHPGLIFQKYVHLNPTSVLVLLRTSHTLMNNFEKKSKEESLKNPDKLVGQSKFNLAIHEISLHKKFK